MSAPHELPALHLINTVLAGVTGQDLYFAQQLKAGIEQALADGADTAAFATAVEQLRARLGSPDDARRGFVHWDAAQSPAQPDSLWSRQQIVDALKRLAPYSEATLLITNLRTAFCPPGHRWTERRRTAYREVLDFLAALAVSRKRERTQLTLLFL